MSPALLETVLNVFIPNVIAIVNWWSKFQPTFLILANPDILVRLFFFLIICVTALWKVWEAFENEKKWYEVTLLIGLVIYSAFYTLGNGQNLITPVVVFPEEFSLKLNNINYKEGPDKNIYFLTRYPIERPIALAIKDSFNNLVSNQYQVLDDKRTVYINFMFDDKNDQTTVYESNEAMAKQGFLFDYETRLSIFDKAYSKRKKLQSRKEVGIK